MVRTWPGRPFGFGTVPETFAHPVTRSVESRSRLPKLLGVLV